ncbi:hypothetical protein COO60DRAFT_132056 [Scenedesmus sp. NREL 46B-D3]|nr:hypothetical protein COO60DRAFT_132056 [Scenedesmus sp. NREL 46B-D3]
MLSIKRQVCNTAQLSRPPRSQHSATACAGYGTPACCSCLQASRASAPAQLAATVSFPSSASFRQPADGYTPSSTPISCDGAAVRANECGSVSCSAAPTRASNVKSQLEGKTAQGGTCTRTASWQHHLLVWAMARQCQCLSNATDMLLYETLRSVPQQAHASLADQALPLHPRPNTLPRTPPSLQPKLSNLDSCLQLPPAATHRMRHAHTHGRKDPRRQKTTLFHHHVAHQT